MDVPVVYRFLTVATLVSAEWINNPRYSSGYVGGFQVPESSSPRVVRCVPCDERRSSATNSLDEYRGNGADNLGYDWSPKAWGGPAFPNKAKMTNRQGDEWSGGRGGRQMPGSWEPRERCQGCSSAESGWGGRYTERPSSWDDRWERDRNSFGTSTQRPGSWPTTGAPNEETVTSQVLGIMYRNDKRLPVPWQGDSRSMRWDGFRNGIPWEEPDKIDKRSWSEEPGFQAWDESGKGSAGWDSQGKGHYAASWKYGSPTTGGSSWNRPWSASDSGRPDERGYGQGNRLPFGSSYPQQPSNKYPQSSNNYPLQSSYPQSSNYPSQSNYPQSSSSQYPSSPIYSTDRPTYSTSSWRPTTGPYPTTGRPQQPYPDIIIHRPSYQESTPHPGYQSTQPQRPNYRPQEGTSWNYQDRYDQNRPGQWTTPRPNQNYLPQSLRPTTRPGYGQFGDRPPAGVPSITIWNGQPNDYDSRPGSKPPKGYYTGFITEIHDSNYLGGNRNPISRPPSNYPSSFPTRPSSDRYPDNSHFLASSGYPTDDRDKYPNTGGSHYPSTGGDRYPSDRYPIYEPNPRPSYGNSYDRPGSGFDDKYPSQRPHDRNPWYESDRNRPDYGNDRYPTPGSKYPSNDRYPTYDRYPSNVGTSYDKDRYPSYDKDRYPSYNKDRYPNNDRDRYPSNDRDRYPNDRYPNRPGSSDHDRGPLPNSDSGTWNYGEEEQNKDGTYKRSGGSYPPYKGGKYFTSSYLATASTPASSNDIEGKKPGTDETTTASSQEQQFVPS